MPCPAASCSREWWNASIVADGPYTLSLPLPIPGSDPYSFQQVLTHWPAPLRVDGNATATLSQTASDAWVRVSGGGNATLAIALARETAPGSTPEAFLRARWGPTAEEVRPVALVVQASGEPAVTLTYEAASDLCERRARFASSDAPIDGRMTLPGADVAGCAE